MKKRKKASKITLFNLSGLTKENFEVIGLVLGVVVATSSDAETRLKCHRALKNFRGLKRIAMRMIRGRR